MDTGGRAAWGCPLDWISKGDAVGCVGLRGGLRTGGSVPCSHSFDEDVLPVHSDSIRAAAVIVGELEARTVALCLDGMGADAPIHLDGVCRMPSKAGGGLDPRCALVADADGARAVGLGGGESDACAGVSSIGTTVNLPVVVVYLPLTAGSVSDTLVSTN
jgi:hypothetical protein